MNKPITPEEMETYVNATWEKCQAEAWEDPVGYCTLEQLTWLQRVVPSTGTIALYTSPPQREWVGLTEEQFLEASRLAEEGNYMVAFQRIQQWLKEKNT